MSDSIVAQDVTKSFARDGDRVEVLKGVSLTIPAGELAAIVGPSGVGKSTLLHLLGGLERPTGGAIRYGDTDLALLSDVELARFRNGRVGFVFQFHHLLPERSAMTEALNSVPINASNPNPGRQNRVYLAVLFALSAPEFLVQK